MTFRFNLLTYKFERKLTVNPYHQMYLVYVSKPFVSQFSLSCIISTTYFLCYQLYSSIGFILESQTERLFLFLLLFDSFRAVYSDKYYVCTASVYRESIVIRNDRFSFLQKYLPYQLTTRRQMYSERKVAQDVKLLDTGVNGIDDLKRINIWKAFSRDKE